MDSLHRFLRQSLPDIIATGLTVPGDKNAELSSEEIQISFSSAGKFDVGTKNLEIVVFANNYPGRSDCLQSDRIPRMQYTIRHDLDYADFKDITFSLYVHLGVGGYAEG